MAKNNKIAKKPEIKKDTGLVDEYLPYNVSPVHFILASSLFAPLTQQNPLGSYFKAIDGQPRPYRYYSHSSSIELAVNSYFLSIDNDFLVFAFLLKKLEFTNKDRKRDNLLSSVKISYEEVKEFFELKDTTKRSRSKIIQAIDRLSDVKLTIINKNGVTKASLISQTDYLADKSGINVIFPPCLILLYLNFKQVSYVDLDKFREIKSGFAKKLYVYLTSVNVPKISLLVFKKLLGHHVDQCFKPFYEEVDDEVSFCGELTNCRSTNDHRFRADLNSAFEELYNLGVMAKTTAIGKGAKTVYLLGKMRKSKSVLTDKEMDDFQNEANKNSDKLRQIKEQDQAAFSTGEELDEYEKYCQSEELLLKQLDLASATKT